MLHVVARRPVNQSSPCLVPAAGTSHSGSGAALPARRMLAVDGGVEGVRSCSSTTSRRIAFGQARLRGPPATGDGRTRWPNASVLPARDRDHRGRNRSTPPGVCGSPAISRSADRFLILPARDVTGRIGRLTCWRSKTASGVESDRGQFDRPVLLERQLLQNARSWPLRNGCLRKCPTAKTMSFRSARWNGIP